MGRNSISVCAADFEGTVGEVDLHVPSQMLLEVDLFFGCLQRIAEPPETVGRKQFLFGDIDVRIDDEMRLYDFGNLFLFDAAGGVIRGSVFRNGGPVVRLMLRSATIAPTVRRTSQRSIAHTRSTSASVSISSYEEICAKVSVRFFALFAILAGAILRPRYLRKGGCSSLAKKVSLRSKGVWLGWGQTQAQC